MEKFRSPESNPVQEFSHEVDLGIESHHLLMADAKEALTTLETITPDYETITFNSIHPSRKNQPLENIRFGKADGSVNRAEVSAGGTTFVSDITGWHQSNDPSRYFSHGHMINLINQSFAVPDDILDKPADDSSYLDSLCHSLEANHSLQHVLRNRTYQYNEVTINDVSSIDEVDFRIQSAESGGQLLAIIVEAATPYYIGETFDGTQDSTVYKTIQYVATSSSMGRAKVTLSGASPRTGDLARYEENHPDDLRDTFQRSIKAVVDSKLSEPSLKSF